MTAADIYLSAYQGWKPKQDPKQKRSPEEEQKQATILDFMEAKLRLRAKGDQS